MIPVRHVRAQTRAQIRSVGVRTLDDADCGVIGRAWLDCNVVVVRNQELTLPECHALQPSLPAARAGTDHAPAGIPAA